MPRGQSFSRSRKPKPLAMQAAELALAVPQVVAHRLTRLALAGPVLSLRDRAEFKLMGAEKTAAFKESWGAMAAASLRANQQLAMTLWTSALFPWSKGSATPSAAAAKYQRAALGLLGTGMAPVHRRAVANAKRLKRLKHIKPR